MRGVRFAAITEREAVEHVFDAFSRGVGGWVATSNTDHLRRATRDAAFRATLADADFVVADGMPLVWASRLAGSPLPERVAGSSMTLALTREASAAGRSVFLLGGNPGVAERAQARLQRDDPKLCISGTYCPPRGFESDPEQMRRIREALERARPDLVLVALGSPKQERLICELSSIGVLPQAWWFGVGITLSFLCDDVKRAPRWMQRTGLEWVHRLLQEPRRLAKRYLLEGIPFALGLLAGAWLSRFRRSKRVAGGSEGSASTIDH